MPDKSLQELISTMRFPLGGIDLSQKPSGQHPGTTAAGQNVRGFEPLTGRARGGSRAGIRRYIDEQVDGNHYIQHLNYIVTASGEAVGAAFDGVDLGDIGGLGMDNFGGLDANQFAGWGGGGYQPAKPRRKQFRVTVEILSINVTLQPGERTSLLPKDGPPFTSASFPARVGNTAVVRATIRDFTGTAQAFLGLALVTKPAGRPGDGDTGTSVFDLNDPPLGTVDFTVNNTRVEKVSYRADNPANTITGANKVQINFTAPKPASPPSDSGGDDGHGHCDGMELHIVVERKVIELSVLISDDILANVTYPVVSPYNMGSVPNIDGNTGPVGGNANAAAGTWRATAHGSNLLLEALGQQANVDLSQNTPSPPACPLHAQAFNTIFQKNTSYEAAPGFPNSGLVQQFVFFTLSVI